MLKFMNVKQKDSCTKLYIDKGSGKCYARRNREIVSSLTEFAGCLDVRTSLELENSKTLKEIQLKEEAV